MHAETSKPSVTATWRATAAIAIATGVGLAAARLFAALNAPPPGAGEHALAWVVYYLVVGPVVGFLYYFVVAATFNTRVLWVATSGLGAYVFLSWFAWPVLVQRPAAALGDLGGAAVAAAGRQELLAREGWARALLSARRYGPPGATPPMLEVRPSDAGFGVRVVNSGDSEIVVALARVAADPGASGGWRGCGYSGHAGESAEEWVTLSVGQSAFFDLEPYCAELFLDLDAHYEYRVGNETAPVENGWWTSSAFAAPGGRADEHGSGSTRLPSSYDAREFFGAVAREE